MMSNKAAESDGMRTAPDQPYASFPTRGNSTAAH